MQRRATAVFAAFFLVVAVGAYAFVTTAEEPAVAIDEGNQDFALSNGSSFTVGGTEYAVGSLNGTEGSAEATWRNESARYTGTLENDSTVTYEDGNFTLLVDEGESPEGFRLVEVQSVDRPTTTMNGTTYVVVEEGTNRTLVPREEYLPEPRVEEFALGDEYPFEGNTTTVASVTASEVTVEWFAPRTETVEFGEGENTTLAGTSYTAHFPDAETLVLTTEYADYGTDLQRQDAFHDRMNGLWGVVILSGLAVVLLVGMAFLPSRY